MIPLPQHEIHIVVGAANCKGIEHHANIVVVDEPPCNIVGGGDRIASLHFVFPSATKISVRNPCLQPRDRVRSIEYVFAIDFVATDGFGPEACNIDLGLR